MADVRHLESVFLCISIANYWISMKFGLQTPTLICRRTFEYWYVVTVTWLQVCAHCCSHVTVTTYQYSNVRIQINTA